MSQQYDVVVIGAGPGGYVAAIRAAQLGFKTVCIEKWIGKDGKPSLGGTCLNVGCIPSKALLDSSHHYHDAQHLFADHGIQVGEVSLDLKTVMARKDKVVNNLTRGVQGLLKKNKVELRTGTARLREGKRVEVVSEDGQVETIQAEHIIIAMGKRHGSLIHSLRRTVKRQPEELSRVSDIQNSDKLVLGGMVWNWPDLEARHAIV